MPTSPGTGGPFGAERPIIMTGARVPAHLAFFDYSLCLVAAARGLVSACRAAPEAM